MKKLEAILSIIWSVSALVHLRCEGFLSTEHVYTNTGASPTPFPHPKKLEPAQSTPLNSDTSIILRHGNTLLTITLSVFLI